MGRPRTRKPEQVRIEISDGDWLLVKKHLNAGEQRTIYAKMLRGERGEIDPVKVGVSSIMGYLLDWSFCDAEGKPIVIRDQMPDVVTAALDALDTDTFEEVLKAINAHAEATKAAREQERAVPFTASESSPT